MLIEYSCKLRDLNDELVRSTIYDIPSLHGLYWIGMKQFGTDT